MSTSAAQLTTPQGPGYATRRDLTPIAFGGFLVASVATGGHTDEVTLLSPRPNGPGLAAS